MSTIAGSKATNFKAVKFVLWLIIVSVVMMFAGLTSGYIVRQAEGNWTAFHLPDIFWFSTLVILSSSFTMHWAYLSAKKGNAGHQKIALWLSMVLGIVFLICQWEAWINLVSQGIYLAGNPSGSFLYVISGLHGLHIVAGILLIVSSLLGVYRNVAPERNVFKMEIASIFWHFIDILWIYLFVFLLLNH